MKISGHPKVKLVALTDAARTLETFLGRPLPGKGMRAGPRGQPHALDSVPSASAGA